MSFWDIISGTTLWRFTARYPTYQMVYSQKLNQLALMTRGSSLGESGIVMINPQTGTSTTSFVSKLLSCFAFSQTSEGLVCGMDAHGLGLFNVPTRRWRHIEYPGTMTSVSSLPNGTVVANIAGSGIQLLNLDEESQHQTILPRTLCTPSTRAGLSLFS